MPEPDSNQAPHSVEYDRDKSIKIALDSLSNPPSLKNEDYDTQEYKNRFYTNKPLLDELVSEPEYQSQIFSLIGQMLEPEEISDELAVVALEFVLEHDTEAKNYISNLTNNKKYLQNIIYTANKNTYVNFNQDENVGRAIKKRALELVMPFLIEELTSHDPSPAWGEIGNAATTIELSTIFDKVAASLTSDEPAIEITAELISSDLGNLVTSKEKLKFFMEKFNLPFESIVNDWDSSNMDSAYKSIRQSDSNKTWRINFEKLLEIELRRPGISRYLYSECGIANFGRYPTNILIDQYDARYDTTSPYGVALFAKADNDGALYDTDYLIDFQNDLKNENFKLRIFECQDSLDVISALNSSRRQFGKIEFGILDAHGGEKFISLGNYGENLSLYSVLNPNAPSILRAFVEDPTIILNSCQTGFEHGIGGHLSSLGASVYAPETSTSIESLRFNPDAGEKKFTVEFRNEGHARPFKQGARTN